MRGSMNADDVRLKLARIKAGKSQRDLALATGVSEHMVSKWETRRLSPPREIQEKIAAVLGVKRWEVFS